MTPNTLVELVRTQSHVRADQIAYIFLGDGGAEEARCSYAELDERARAIAATLIAGGAAVGDRALLLYPPGLDFITAFLGCLFAGVVAVPVVPPRNARAGAKCLAVVEDCHATVALTTTAFHAAYNAWSRDAASIEATDYCTDVIPPSAAAEWSAPAIEPNSVAFLQYTSGSTGTPKGVVVTHGNILANERACATAFEHSDRSVVVGWLPLFHDMGLIGNTLQPLYAGAMSVLMPPLAFLQQPARWLEAITRYRARTSGGPNFAYELCVREIPEARLSRFELSSWDLAFTGAEPVRAETLARFAAKFERCGFRRSAFFPCYGLAEATLFVTGGPKGEQALLSIDANALEQGEVRPAADGATRARHVVGCGRTSGGQQLRIVDPATCTATSPGALGEVWLAGPSVARGYWNRSDETERAFGAALAGSDARWLRTGDLGFVRDGQLFVTGRLKDLILIRGRNHYPQDIELTVEASHAALAANCGAAFSVEIDGDEQLVVVHEVAFAHRHGIDRAAVEGAIRRAVAQEHGLSVAAICLIKPRSIPKTSSGKVQRRACRDMYQQGRLELLADRSRIGERQQPRVVTGEVSAPISLPSGIARDAVIAATEGKPAGESSELGAALELELHQEIARLLRVSADALDPRAPLGTVGLDSLAVAQLCSFARDRFGLRLAPAAFLDEHNLYSLCLTATSDPLDSAAVPTGEQPMIIAAPVRRAVASDGGEVDLSLAYFPTGNLDQAERFSLMLRTAQFADQHGFCALWIPERHFHPFGGSCPNPAVIAAAFAATTRRIRLRAGSVVLPLHHPLRVAEEWSVVDNLSHGRVELSFAAGWNANDFVLAPDAFADRRNLTLTCIETVRRLWRGEALELQNGAGDPVRIRIQPEPVQNDLEVWFTCTGGTEGFLLAGAHGYNILTGLLFQSIDELAVKLSLYRQARYRHGHAPRAGRVTLMVHTYVGATAAEVKQRVREPLIRYLASSVDLWQQEAERLRRRTPSEQAAVLDFAVERYQRHSALIGTPEACADFVARARAIGVDEIACLVDFGLSTELVLGGLELLDQLRGQLTSSASPQGPRGPQTQVGAGE